MLIGDIPHESCVIKILSIKQFCFGNLTNKIYSIKVNIICNQTLDQWEVVL